MKIAIILVFLTIGFSSGNSQGASPATCFEAGQKQTSLDNSEIMRLCCHQNSVGPVNCFQTSHQTSPMSDDDIVNLCACSDVKVLDCFGKATKETDLSTADAIALCRSKDSYVQPGFTGEYPSMGPKMWQHAQ